MSVYDAYVHLTAHIVPGPQDLTYFIPLILLPISLNIPRSKLSRWQNIAIFMPLITAASFRAWTAMKGVDVISMNQLLWSTFLIVLEDPWKHYRLVRQTYGTAVGRSPPSSTATGLPEVKADGSLGDLHESDQKNGRQLGRQDQGTFSEQGYPSDIWQRFSWTGKLLGSITLDNWKISRPSHDRLQPRSAGFKDGRSFLIQSAISLARAILILDVTRAYVEYDIYFTNPDVAITSPLPFRNLRLVSPQLLRSMVVGAQAYALIGELLYLPAAIPVILNSIGLLPDRFSPHTWPAYFGSPSAIFLHGVRGFWGSFWHQTMRWSTSGPGYAVADALGLQNGSLSRYAAISVSAFGFSGLVHMGLVPPEPLYVRRRVIEVRLCMAGFFWLQPVAILIEALVTGMVIDKTNSWKQGHKRTFRMVLNGVWTIMWFSFSLPLLADAARQLGYWHVWPLPFSIWKWMNGEGLMTWI